MAKVKCPNPKEFMRSGEVLYRVRNWEGKPMQASWRQVQLIYPMQFSLLLAYENEWFYFNTTTQWNDEDHCGYYDDIIKTPLGFQLVKQNHTIAEFKTEKSYR